MREHAFPMHVRFDPSFAIVVLAVFFIAVFAMLTTRKKENRIGGHFGLVLVGMGAIAALLFALRFWAQPSFAVAEESSLHFGAVPSQVIAGGIVLLGVFIASILAAFRRGGGAALGGLLILVFGGFGVLLFSFMFFSSMNYKHFQVGGTTSVAAAEYGDLRVSPSEIPLSHTAAEVSGEWTDDVANHELDLSTIPENRPDWVDETEADWDENRKVWTKTVQVGPFETEEVCKERYREAVQDAVREYARWHAAKIQHIDPSLADYNPLDLPEIHASLSRSTRSKSLGRTKRYEYRNGQVTDVYSTTAKVSVGDAESDEPWHVLFARVELDQDFQRKIDKHVRHGVALKRAVHVGGAWGIALLGMVVGLRMFRGASDDVEEIGDPPQAFVSESWESRESPESVEAAAERVSLPASHSKASLINASNVWLILAPIVCTVIYLLAADDFHDMVFEDGFEDFWPKWVWFGCGIAFVVTTLIPLLGERES